MDANQTQALFFNHIKSKIPSHLSFVDEIAELLNISNDSAYRRIRGEKPIGLDEMQVLCNAYHISLDQVLQLQTNTFIFSGKFLDPYAFGLNQYLQFVQNSLESFKSMQNPHYYMNVKDIPHFNFMPFPELCAFKFFFWKRTVIGYPEIAKQQFNGIEDDLETLELAKKIIELYTQISSTEIWIEESIMCTIRQVEFYKESNIFTDNHIVLKIYAQLEELLNHMEMQAEIGKKFSYDQSPAPNAASYDLYINEYLLGDNTVYVQGTGRQITFLNHSGLNFISTQDTKFCDYTFKKLQNIIRKSTHVSLVGEKERSVFFNTLREKIHKRMKNIN